MISSSYTLANELLKKEDNFITITIENREYVIESIGFVKTHANIDDSVMHITINARDGGSGNILR